MPCCFVSMGDNRNDDRWFWMTAVTIVIAWSAAVSMLAMSALSTSAISTAG